MYLPNAGNQSGTHRTYRADGSLANSSPKLILPQALSRTFLSIYNTGGSTIFMEHGCARATATMSNGVVTGFTILNAGFGFTRPPLVELKGGGGSGFILPALAGSGWDGRGQVDGWPTPHGVNLLVTPPAYARPCKAHAVLTSGAVTSIVVDDPGSGYTNIPEVFLSNDPNDPFGCADPSLNSGSGIPLNSYFLNGTFCHTDAIALYTATTATYYLEYAP